MGVRGRKPIPTEIKKLSGNPGKRKLNDAEPQLAKADIRVPKGKLPPSARALWKSLAPQLSELGVLKSTDLPALEVMCMHYQLLRDAWKVIREEGLTVEVVTATSMSIKKHPATTIFRENAMSFKAFATEFGLTPSSRVRIQVEPVHEKTLAELLFSGVDAEDA